DHEGLGVQAGAAAAEHTGRFGMPTRLHFVQVHALLKQVLAVVRVAAVHRRHVVGRERVGDDADLGTTAGEGGEPGYPIVAGNEVGRDQQGFLTGGRQHVGQAPGEPVVAVPAA